MSKSVPYVVNLCDVTLHDIPLVGGKAASLGEMIRALTQHTLTQHNVRVPHGFVVTTDAYRALLSSNHLAEHILELQKNITADTLDETVGRIAQTIRDLIAKSQMPDELRQQISAAYQQLSDEYHEENCTVAVRSSATAEDLPSASFAGQQESFLYIAGIDALCAAIIRAMASLFTERALLYRREHNIDPKTVALAVCVQKMVHADTACAGVMFTLDTESGFPDVIMINGTYGLGEMVVQGKVNADEFWIAKRRSPDGSFPVIRKKNGSKTERMGVDAQGEIALFSVSLDEQDQFVLTEQELQELARHAMVIEDYYSQLYQRWMPMDIEWAKDGTDGLLYIVQARPETVYGGSKAGQTAGQATQIPPMIIDQLQANVQPKILVTGQSIGGRIVQGTARVIQDYNGTATFQQGDILITRMTDPDWIPLLRKAAGIITDLGGRTCHAAIVSREMGIPAVIGTRDATRTIADGAQITIDCSQGLQGFVYEGHVPFTTTKVRLSDLPQLATSLLINIAQPERAFVASQLPVAGVGLARLEFIISRDIGIHPLAIIAPERITDMATRRQIETVSLAYESPRDYFVSKLAEGVATIAAAFYPRPVIVRWSDFKSNEYRNLLGGAWFEPTEENPMIGWRGASRYVSERYQPAFALECEAIRRVRNTWGFTNVHTMVPFVRSVKEAQKVNVLLEQLGIRRGDHGLKWYMMVEIPANVICFDDYVPLFDGFSIGSNDLTQLVLGVDRDAAALHEQYDERDPAVLTMIQQAIARARAAGTYISICGEAPATYPELADLLIEQGISAISMASDAIIPFLLRKQHQVPGE
jgi:pyruvate,water dikinase